MNYASTRYLGSTVRPGSAVSGTHYASHAERKPHTHCWMALAVFDQFPSVPSLAGSQTQAAITGKESLSVSTKAVGQAAKAEPICIEFELFDDESPVACANFRRLCAGGPTFGNSSSSNSNHDELTSTGGTATAAPWQSRSDTHYYKSLVPFYKGTSIHKIIPGFCIQGGDLTMRLLPSTTGSATYRSSNQFSGLPARRIAFADENKRRRHNEAGLLSMANTGPNSNGTQFFITTSAAHEQALNGRHVCFGRVSSGLDRLLAEVAPYGDVQGRPTKHVVVVDCGAGELPVNSSTDYLSEDVVPLLGESAREGEEAREQEADHTREAVDATPVLPAVPCAAAEQGRAGQEEGQPAAATPPRAASPKPSEVNILVVGSGITCDSESAGEYGAPKSGRVKASDDSAAAAKAVETPFSAAESAAAAADSVAMVAAPPPAADEAAGPRPALKSSLKAGPRNTQKRVTIQL